MSSVEEVERAQVALDRLYSELLPFSNDPVVTDLLKVLRMTDETLANVRTTVVMLHEAKLL